MLDQTGLTKCESTTKLPEITAFPNRLTVHHSHILTLETSKAFYSKTSDKIPQEKFLSLKLYEIVCRNSDNYARFSLNFQPVT
jgi:hypothetical protein